MLIVVLVVVVVLAGLILPALALAKYKSKRIQCVNNLKLVALEFRVFASDHSNAFPAQLAGNLGGAQEFVRSGEVFKHFLTIPWRTSASTSVGGKQPLNSVWLRSLRLIKSRLIALGLWFKWWTPGHHEHQFSSGSLHYKFRQVSDPPVRLSAEPVAAKTIGCS